MANPLIRLIFFVSFSLISWSSYTQTTSDVQFFKKTVSLEERAEKSQIISPDKNAIQHTGKIVFGVYRNLISSQDSHTCAFYPTCSRYGQHAIGQHGLISGGVMTLDRLMRCHTLAPEKYSIDMSRRKLVDHVE